MGIVQDQVIGRDPGAPEFPGSGHQHAVRRILVKITRKLIAADGGRMTEWGILKPEMVSRAGKPIQQGFAKHQP